MSNLNKIIFTFLILNFLFYQNAFARSFSLSECTEISQSVNENAPLVVDKMTSLRATICTLGPILIYNFEVDNSIDFVPDSFDKKIRKQWCSNPKFKILIDGLKEIHFEYYRIDGEFIKTIIISRKYC